MKESKTEGHQVVVKIILAFFLTANIFAQDNAIEEEEVGVIVGIDKVVKLDFRPSTKVEVGNDDILSYTLIPDDNIREITLKGKTPGKTSLILRGVNGEIKARYRVTVTANDLSKTVIRLREFFDEIEGIEVKIKGGIVVVEGKIIVPSDVGKIAVVLDREEFQKDVIVAVELHPQTQKIIAQKMQEEIQRNGMKDVSVRVVNGQFWLEGFITRQGNDALALRIAEGFLSDRLATLAEASGRVERYKKSAIQSFISPNIKPPPAPPSKLIKIVAQFVELTKEYGKTFGFKWIPAISGEGGTIQFGRTTDGGVTTRSNGTLSGTISNLFPKLASAKSAGNARVVQQGMIVVKDGSSDARIVRNTKIPFALGTGDFTRGQEANAGFALTLNPRIRSEENVEMGLNIKISVSNSTAGGTPQETSNEINTTVVVKSKESAVIGGISSSGTTTRYDQDPPFGADTFENASPLFSFIRSKDFRNNKNQFVVFVTPEILQSASQGTDDIKRKFRRRRR